LREGFIEEAGLVYHDEYLPMVYKCTVPKEIRIYEYYYLGGLSLMEERNSESLRYYKLVLDDIAFSTFQARVSYNIGLVYFKLTNFSQSLEYVKKASEIYILEDKFEELSDSYNLLGSIYLKLEELAVAEKYLKLGIKLATKHNYPKVKSRILHNLAIIEKRRKEVKKATILLEKSLALKVDSDDKVITAVELFEILLKNKNYQKVACILDKLEQESNKISSKNYHKLLIIRGRVNLHFGKLEMYIKDFDVALKYFFEHEMWNYIGMYSEEYADNLFKHKKYKKAGEVYKLKILSQKKGENTHEK